MPIFRFSFLSRAPLFALTSCLALAAVPNLASADDTNAQNTNQLERFSLIEENDSIYFNTDKHYTQGFRLSDLAPDLWNKPFDLMNAITPIFAHSGAASVDRRYAWILGQSLFTPENLTLKPPNPYDRPYGGWLYVGLSLLQDTNRNTLENLELDLGVVGPPALGRETQNDFHQFIGVNQAQGWSRQIQTEPGGMLSYEKFWRLRLLGDGHTGIDVVPEVGATVGNVFTYADAGGMIRFGKNLQVDYGPIRIRPSLSGTDYFDTRDFDGTFGYYFYAGVQGRAVGRNIFLDGNSFRPSASVNKKILVADFQTGVALYWSSKFRLDFSVMQRTEEFYGQKTPDVLGTAALAFSW